MEQISTLVKSGFKKKKFPYFALKKAVGKKIVVVGSSGCGKTTFARRLSQVTNIPHYEIDSMFWKPDWVMTKDDEFRSLVDNVTKHNEWIMDGNYRKVQDLTIGRADTVIWLNYTFLKVLHQVTFRTAERLISKEPLWHNNKESLKMALSKDSIILYTITHYKSKKRWYNKLIRHSDCKGINWIQIKNTKDEQKFFNSFK